MSLFGYIYIYIYILIEQLNNMIIVKKISYFFGKKKANKEKNKLIYFFGASCFVVGLWKWLVFTVGVIESDWCHWKWLVCSLFASARWFLIWPKHFIFAPRLNTLFHRDTFGTFWLENVLPYSPPPPPPPPLATPLSLILCIVWMAAKLKSPQIT